MDEASTRRGVDTVHSRFDARVAVLAGDFLFAQASGTWPTSMTSRW